MEYVKHYFLSPKYLAKVMSNCSGARMPRLTTKFIKSNEAYIPIPSLKTQQKTVTYLDEISQKIQNLKSVQKVKMESLVSLKASILDQAFKGQL
jgi:type I restriction enzyme S subunit